MAFKNPYPLKTFRYLSPIFGIPASFLIISHWGYGVRGFIIFQDASLVFKTVFCAVSGMFVAFAYAKKSFKHRLFARLLSGCITGASALWVVGGYLYLRGFPKDMFEIELGLGAIIVGLIYLFLYALFTWDSRVLRHPFAGQDD